MRAVSWDAAVAAAKRRLNQELRQPLLYDYGMSEMLTRSNRIQVQYQLTVQSESKRRLI